MKKKHREFTSYWTPQQTLIVSLTCMTLIRALIKLYSGLFFRNHKGQRPFPPLSRETANGCFFFNNHPPPKNGHSKVGKFSNILKAHFSKWGWFPSWA